MRCVALVGGAIAAFERFVAIKHSGMVAEQVQAGIALQQLRPDSSPSSGP